MKVSCLLIAAIILIFANIHPTVSADLIHRYSFESDVSDSISGADGILMNDAFIDAGQVFCDGSDDYVDLPAPVIAINTLTTGLTLELWSTQPAINQAYSMTTSFGGQWLNGTGRDYLMISTTRGNDVSRAAIANTPDDVSPWDDEIGVNGPELNDAIEHYYVLTIDDPAEDGTGQIAYFIDGVLQGNADLDGTLISGLSNDVAYLARGTYTNDGSPQCSINEYRIHNTALTVQQIQDHYAWGPDWISAPLVQVTESDGITILYTDNPVHTDTYEVVLLQQPTEDVVITVIPPTGFSVGNGSGQNLQLTFSEEDWDQPQTVTIEIADPQIEFGDIEIIQHTSQSNDPAYNQAVRSIEVMLKEDICGEWGFLEADFNFDCLVDLEDFSMLASLWLATDSPLGLDSFVQDWLLETLDYDEEIFARSIQKSETPFSINSANIQNTIDEKVYGHFLEHIYHSVNGGLWGDVIWNRSFESAYGDGSGIWSIEGDELVQTSLATDVHIEFGNTSWDDYELTLQARKDGGNEAFLILFRSADSNNFYWCNIGGWGNTQHAFEKEVDGARGVVGSTTSGSITAEDWYNIRVRCEGNHYQVYLNESLILEYTDESDAFMTGQIGLGTWGTQARYRNIQVTDLSGSTVLYSGLPSLPENQYLVDSWETYGAGTFSRTSADALNDEYSVMITAGVSNIGLEQGNQKFTQQPYQGSLWMKGDVPAGIKVEFLDAQTQTLLGQAMIPAPTDTWTEYPFQITPSISTDDGIIRITLQGAGMLYLDQVSMMAQDAIDVGGYRPDLLQAVEGLRPPIIRWPGGCYASAYFWKDGIGPQEDRIKYPINLWDDQDTNSYGSDEFLRMCEAIGAEPLIVVNIGLLSGTCGVSIPYMLDQEQYLTDVEDWMEYCNGSIETEWGAIRAANGHPEPYNVMYWEIDNEVWSTGYGGGITNYIAKVKEYAPAMRAKAAELGTSVKLIACGSGSYNQGWNQSLIDECADLIDYISTHHYEGPDNFKQGPREYEAFIEELGGIIAASSNPDLKIYMSEWNAQSTDWRTGLYAGGLLNGFERTGDVFEIGGPALFLRHISATDWDNAFINFDHTGWFPAPNYQVMKLWWDHFAPNRLETTGDDTDLNVVSTLSDDESTLYIRVVNPDNESKSVEFEIDGSFIPETAYMDYYAPGSLNARNTLDDPEAVQQKAKIVGLKGQTLRLIMPAYSAGVITVETSQPHGPL